MKAAIHRTRERRGQSISYWGKLRFADSTNLYPDFPQNAIGFDGVLFSLELDGADGVRLEAPGDQLISRLPDEDAAAASGRPQDLLLARAFEAGRGVDRIADDGELEAGAAPDAAGDERPREDADAHANLGP